MESTPYQISISPPNDEKKLFDFSCQMSEVRVAIHDSILIDPPPLGTGRSGRTSSTNPVVRTSYGGNLPQLGPTTRWLKNISGNSSISEIGDWFFAEKIPVSLPFLGRDRGTISGPLLRLRTPWMLLSTLITWRPLDDRPTDVGPRRVQGSHLQKEGDGPESLDNN